MMHNDPDRAFYGMRHVSLANEQGAIDSLLIADGLFRSANPALRRRYVHLVDSVKERGGRVYVFSSAHVSGEQLAQVRGERERGAPRLGHVLDTLCTRADGQFPQVTGVAAILRFPLPDIADLDAEGGDDAADAAEADEEEAGGADADVDRLAAATAAMLMIPPSGRSSPDFGSDGV